VNKQKESCKISSSPAHPLFANLNKKAYEAADTIHINLLLSKRQEKQNMLITGEINKRGMERL